MELKHRINQYGIQAIFIIWAILFAALSLYRYYSVQLFYYDFGIFSHILWQLSRFKIATINHIALGQIIFLGDHFNPSLVLIAPLYWLTSDIRILLIQQGLITVASAFLIYLISLKNSLAKIMALTLSFTFLVFAGTGNAVITDWHPEPTAAFFLLLFYYLYQYTNHKKLAVAAVAIFLGFKESNALSLVFLLIPILILNKEKRGRTIMIALTALIYFFLATKIFIPLISPRGYIYSPEIDANPLNTIQQILQSPSKLKLTFDSFISFGFLPITTVTGIIPVLLELSIRLIPTKSIFQNLTLGQHYNVYLGVFLSLGAIHSLVQIQKKFNLKKSGQIALIAYVLIFSLYSARKIAISPLNLVINPVFWQQLTPSNYIFEEVEKVPEKGTVMSQNNLLPYISNRTNNLYYLTEEYQKIKPNIIFYDLSENQNPNNRYGSDKVDMQKLTEQLLNDRQYKRIETKNKNVFIFIHKLYH
jgi:uncharacterized membrane protein